MHYNYLAQHERAVSTFQVSHLLLIGPFSELCDVVWELRRMRLKLSFPTHCIIAAEVVSCECIDGQRLSPWCATPVVPGDTDSSI